jgi:hypothetical protein
MMMGMAERHPNLDTKVMRPGVRERDLDYIGGSDQQWSKAAAKLEHQGPECTLHKHNDYLYTVTVHKQ